MVQEQVVETNVRTKNKYIMYTYMIHYDYLRVNQLILTIITKYHNEILCNCILRLVLTMVVQSVTLQIQGTNVRTKQINKSRQRKNGLQK